MLRLFWWSTCSSLHISISHLFHFWSTAIHPISAAFGNFFFFLSNFAFFPYLFGVRLSPSCVCSGTNILHNKRPNWPKPLSLRSKSELARAQALEIMAEDFNRTALLVIDMQVLTCLLSHVVLSSSECVRRN